MRLIGMLDSPYVRRTALTLAALDIPFVHEPLSVFRHYDAFAAINPVVKAPTAVTDDGVVLLDSTLIIDYALKALAGGRSLGPIDPRLAVFDVRLTGLGLAACEKAVQIVYERQLRPAEKLHQPWMDRVTGQLRAALSAIEADIDGAGWLLGPPPSEAGVTLVVAGTFISALIPDVVSLADYPRLAALTAAAERTELFRAWPHE
ncbi:glutathione S-transferase [Pleomorphomonas sp. JP5]|uniref:glutathione S-transferase n=1 Tax=Pleomorphomonas sp. JP5 TaxID=2942998 RepID=UPI002044B67C|nr:glutathione S-transferase N-terminal domain-containing protein [Pleomorphomonas sp. JP5]MCM5559287.1 glutathione S-transferase [Pleomorphomonas sp. JP5]